MWINFTFTEMCKILSHIVKIYINLNYCNINYLQQITDKFIMWFKEKNIWYVWKYFIFSLKFNYLLQKFLIRKRNYNLKLYGVLKTISNRKFEHL